MGSFIDSLQKQIDRVLSEVDSKCYGIAYDLFMTTIQLTPHGTKWARGNLINDWHIAANTFSTAIFSPVDAKGNSKVTANSDTTGTGSINRVESFRKKRVFYGKDGFLSLTNNQPYAIRAEYLGWPVEDSTGGWKWTGEVQPYGMVRKALTIVSAKYR